MEDLISIIIPTYNRANLIKRSIESVEKQSFKNYEIIIVDNNSTDNTEFIVKKFSSLPIKYFVVDNNNNIAKARNYGIMKANGNLIAFLDSDDYWEHNKLELCYKKINQGFDLVFHNLKITNINKSKILNKYLKGRRLKKPYFKDLIINGNPICNSSVLVKKKILIDVNLINESDGMRATEDYNTWIKVCMLTNKIYFINHTLGYYEQDHTSASNKNMSISTLNAVKEYKSLLNKSETIHLRSRIIYINAKYKFDNKKFNQCIKNFKTSFKFGKLIIKIKSIYHLIMLLFVK